MSLVGTLAKVAIGVAVAKGMSSLAKGSASSSQASAGGGLGDLLGGLMGGGSAGQTGASGGLGDLLGGLMGGQAAQGGAQGGGLADMLGGLMGGGAAAGGLGGLLGALAGGQAAPSNDQSFGEVLNSSFANKGEPDVEPTAHQNAAAALMIAAMIQAAKSDGTIQDDEKQKLLSNLDGATAEEMAFVQAQINAPMSIPTLVAAVPAGMQSQVYSMSVMAINLDSQAEAQYLSDLAHALGLNKQAVNQIHGQLGVPALYA